MEPARVPGVLDGVGSEAVTGDLDERLGHRLGCHPADGHVPRRVPPEREVDLADGRLGGLGQLAPEPRTGEGGAAHDGRAPQELTAGDERTVYVGVSHMGAIVTFAGGGQPTGG